jgi:hypothetical protein
MGTPVESTCIVTHSQGLGVNTTSSATKRREQRNLGRKGRWVGGTYIEPGSTNSLWVGSPVPTTGIEFKASDSFNNSKIVVEQWDGSTWFERARTDAIDGEIVMGWSLDDRSVPRTVDVDSGPGYDEYLPQHFTRVVLFVDDNDHWYGGMRYYLSEVRNISGPIPDDAPAGCGVVFEGSVPRPLAGSTRR